MPLKIDKAKCTGCGECVNICPSLALEVVEKKAVLKRPQDCLECRACEVVCERKAIAFE